MDEGRDEFTTYEIVDCATLLSRYAIDAETWTESFETAIPELAYGTRTRPDGVGNEWPPDAWHTVAYGHPGLICYRFRNAILHGEMGIITIGSYCIRESLHMVFPQFHGFPQDDDHHIALPAPKRIKEVDSAAHALCGYVGNRNYAHWWVDIVPVLGQHASGQRVETDVIALPSARAAYQTQTLDLFPDLSRKFVLLEDGDALSCGRLDFVPLITAGDYMPVPSFMTTIAKLKQSLGAPNGNKRSKIFLSRKDVDTRRLENEGELCQMAESLGFQTVTTSGMSITDQIHLFSSASHLIGAHGAGLANLLFCPPHARMLELQCSASINWSIRRLASIIPLTYGTVVGTPWIDAKSEGAWTLDPEVFAGAVRDML